MTEDAMEDIFAAREEDEILDRHSEASPAPVSEHPDDAAVDRFAAAMKAKLAKKREEGRGGWDDKSECSAEFLSKLLRDHVEKGDPLDVGNLAMMLHQRGDSIAPAPVSEEMVERMFAEMRRRMNLPKHIDQESNPDWLPVDDTQVGIEFAVEFLSAAKGGQ